MIKASYWCQLSSELSGDMTLNLDLTGTSLRTDISVGNGQNDAFYEEMLRSTGTGKEEAAKSVKDKGAVRWWNVWPW